MQSSDGDILADPTLFGNDWKVSIFIKQNWKTSKCMSIDYLAAYWNLSHYDSKTPSLWKTSPSTTLGREEMRHYFEWCFCRLSWTRRSYWVLRKLLVRYLRMWLRRWLWMLLHSGGSLCTGNIGFRSFVIDVRGLIRALTTVVQK